jgi:hypothetical protein
MYQPLASALLLLAATSIVQAQGDSDPLSVFYSNTWNVYSETGVNHYFVNKDHTWIGIKRKYETPAGRTPTGTWSLVAGKVCFHHVTGDPDPNDDCFDILGKKLQEPWLMETQSAEEVIGIIHKGRDLYPGR